MNTVVTTVVWDGCRTIGDVVDAAARLHTRRVAVRDAQGELTFAELRSRAHRLADSLLRAGLLPGDRVLEAVPNSTDVIVTDLALALAGLVRVPLNPRLGSREWRAIASDSGARALIVDDRIRGADGERITHELRTETTVRVDAGELDALVAAGSVDARLPTSSPDDLIGLAYSSGTTGTPKGARRTHRMRLASMRAMLRDVLAPTGDVDAYLHAGPAIHTSGLFVLPMLALGAVQVMAQHPTPSAIAATIAAEHITHLAIVPSVIDALTRLPQAERSAFAGVRMLAYAGAPMAPVLIRRAAELLTDRLVQYYGLVEAMPPLTVLTIDDHRRGLRGAPRLLTSAGHVVPGVRIEILGGESIGEVAVSGPMVTAGYWNAAERTDLGKAVQGGALLTGDIGTLEGDVLWLTDRRSDMLISGGYNVYPSEVEVAVASSAGIRSVAVVGLPDERWGQRIALAYTTAGGDDLSDAQQRELGDRLAHLARHKRPKVCRHLSELPLGATGKVDRRAVVSRLLELQATEAAPADERPVTQ
ncbi:AMP-binding protein [Microbacterium sp. H1-D42]|uniref:class I adenylate-forming enzyme family protein n=1 Tax=Microbacterium sp. H1-D42 TaxID=2925844 RepID=UPI001F538AE9|nr:AMP-binding protein [Microbacterium sp. H1-D42]UNK71501.1 AMP-binding protein [Microbacterium sp. H1-D42]